MNGDDRATLFLCGDLMTGRGVDQILSSPSDPAIFESYVKDARGYVALAGQRTRPVPERSRPDVLRDPPLVLRW